MLKIIRHSSSEKLLSLTESFRYETEIGVKELVSDQCDSNLMGNTAKVNQSISPSAHHRYVPRSRSSQLTLRIVCILNSIGILSRVLPL